MIEELKPLEAIPITHGMIAIKVDPNAKYLIFMEAETYDRIGDGFMSDPFNPLPAGTPIYIVDDVDRAVKIYQIMDTHIIHGTNDRNKY